MCSGRRSVGRFLSNGTILNGSIQGQTYTKVLKNKSVEARMRVVIVCGDQKLIYDELNHRANQVAHHLRELGVRAESRVGIYLERNLNMVIAVTEHA